MRRRSIDAITCIKVGIFIGFALLIARAGYIQIGSHEVLHDKATRQQQLLIEIPCMRGPILDRAGEPLAFSVEGSSLAVDPAYLDGENEPSSSDLLGELERRGLVESSEVPELWARMQGSQTRFVWLVRGKLREAEAAELEERYAPALIRLPDPKRLYTLGTAGGSLVGAVNRENVGSIGIEGRYETVIRGEPGKMLDYRSGSQERHEGPGRVVLKAATTGATVELTIDKRVQEIAEARLREAVEEQEAKGGTAIVMDPRTGEILAMVSMPALDPDNVGPKGDTWKIWAVSENYEPGSTYKVVAFAAALESGKLSPSDMINCMGGKRKVPGGLISDHEGCGTIPAYEVLWVSSNIGTGIIAERVGAEDFYRMERLLGFGVTTDAGLPGEERGRIFDPSSRLWSSRSLVTQAFGQEISCTALQLALCYAAIANDGLLVRPLLVRSIRSATGEVLEQHEPEVVRRAMLEETASALRTMLRGVVTEGTGKKAEVSGLLPAGKTGTAQKYIPEEGTYSNQRYIASFVGFAPYDAPRWLCLVVLDEPRGTIWGGSVAAPVFARIMEDVAKLDVRPSEPSAKQLRWIADRKEHTTTVPRVAGLAPGLARKLLKDAGLRPMLEGRGDVVVDVQPAQGTRCRPGQVVSLFLAIPPDTCPELAGFPDLTGMSLRDVVVRARWHGWQLQAIGSGWVVDQRPAPGSPLEDSCKLTVWLAPDSCRTLRTVVSKGS